MADEYVVQLGEMIKEAEALFNNHISPMSLEELKAPKLRGAFLIEICNLWFTVVRE